MSDEIELPDLQAAPDAGDASPASALERLESVAVEVAVEIGRTRMTLGGALALAPGSIVTLDRAADQPVDLLVNGRPIARGEVVVVDEEFGLRVTEIIRPPAQQRPAVDGVPALPAGAPAELPAGG